MIAPPVLWAEVTTPPNRPDLDLIGTLALLAFVTGWILGAFLWT